MGLRTLYILLGLLLIFCVYDLKAQKKLKQGYIQYQVTAIQDVDIQSEEMRSQVAQMGINIYFKNELIRTDENLGIEEMGTLENTSTGIMHILMNMGTLKYAIRFTTAAMIAQKTLQGDYNCSIEYIDETKRISGYDCKLAIITFENLSQIRVYYTDKIAYANTNFTSNFHKLDGFPIQYITLGPGGVELQLTMSVLKKKLPKKVMLLIPPDYKETTMAELESMMALPE